MPNLITTLGAVLVAVISAASAWLIAKRSKSGKIDTSEAAMLWDEGTKMRLELRTEVASLRLQLAEATKSITELNIQIERTRSEAEEARQEALESREEARILLAQIQALSREVELVNKHHADDKAEQEASKRKGGS